MKNPQISQVFATAVKAKIASATALGIVVQWTTADHVKAAGAALAALDLPEDKNPADVFAEAFAEMQNVSQFSQELARYYKSIGKPYFQRGDTVLKSKNALYAQLAEE